MSVVFAGTLLKVLESFFKPVVLAILLAAVFYPLIKKLNQKFKIPWGLGIVIIYAIFLIVFTGIFNILSSSLISIANASQKYEDKISIIYQGLQEYFIANSDSAVLNFFFDVNKDQSLFENISTQLNILPIIKNFAINFTSSMATFLKSTFLILLLSIFLLFEMKSTKAKIESAFSIEKSSKIHNIMTRIAKDTTHYISIKFLISFLTGILVLFSCVVVGIDFPLVWAFLAFILNFVPTFGSIISSVITIIFAFLQCYPSPLPVLFLAIFLLMMNVILGNVVEPKISGENLGVSPFVILVSLSLWGWLWGFLGLILAVPLMVIVKIICENISYLHPIGILLGSERHA